MLNQILWLLSLPIFLAIECVWIVGCIILFVCYILSEISRGVCAIFKHCERRNIFRYLSNYFFGTSSVLGCALIMIIPLAIWFCLTFIDTNWIDGIMFDDDDDYYL